MLRESVVHARRQPPCAACTHHPLGHSPARPPSLPLPFLPSAHSQANIAKDLQNIENRIMLNEAEVLDLQAQKFNLLARDKRLEALEKRLSITPTARSGSISSSDLVGPFMPAPTGLTATFGAATALSEPPFSRLEVDEAAAGTQPAASENVVPNLGAASAMAASAAGKRRASDRADGTPASTKRHRAAHRGSPVAAASTVP